MSSNKDKCKKCAKEFTLKTLNKNKGFCGKCSNTKGITKNRIPKILKDAVWETYIGNTVKGSCYVCKKEITNTTFQAGHIKSEYAGGEITVENLRPTCKSCNVKTGVFNMEEIKKSLEVENVEKCIICETNIKKNDGGFKIEHYEYSIGDIYTCKTCSKFNETNIIALRKKLDIIRFKNNIPFGVGMMHNSNPLYSHSKIPY
jgi:hypothetical protein